MGSISTLLQTPASSRQLLASRSWQRNTFSIRRIRRAGDRWTRPAGVAAKRSQDIARARAGTRCLPYLSDADDARPRSSATGLRRFEGAGLDGVIAKPANGVYEPGKRAMFKVKHARTADCVVAGFRWHKNGHGTPSDRCCSAFTTTAAGCITSASRQRSPWHARQLVASSRRSQARARRTSVAGMG